MYICLCHAVTEHQIEHAIANNACSMRDLREQLNVATQCGKCSLQVKCLLKRYQMSQNEQDDDRSQQSREKVTT